MEVEEYNSSVFCSTGLEIQHWCYVQDGKGPTSLLEDAWVLECLQQVAAYLSMQLTCTVSSAVINQSSTSNLNNLMKTGSVLEFVKSSLRISITFLNLMFTISRF